MIGLCCPHCRSEVSRRRDFLISKTFDLLSGQLIRELGPEGCTKLSPTVLNMLQAPNLKRLFGNETIHAQLEMLSQGIVDKKEELRRDGVWPVLTGKEFMIRKVLGAGTEGTLFGVLCFRHFLAHL